MLARDVMVQQSCGLHLPVEQHIPSVITADINPLNFHISKLALDKMKG